MGGIFIRAKDPKLLADWHQQYLGIHFNGNSYVDLPFVDSDGKLKSGYNVLSFFPHHTTYFDPSEKKVMINLRVEDLFGLLEEIKKQRSRFNR